VEMDALEQANNQLMLEVVDLKDELEDVNEVIRAPCTVYRVHTRLSFCSILFLELTHLLSPRS
jgi:hypothetical protein